MAEIDDFKTTKPHLEGTKENDTYTYPEILKIDNKENILKNCENYLERILRLMKKAIQYYSLKKNKEIQGMKEILIELKKMNRKLDEIKKGR